uniref:Uncharacterized protein n=1 Tax=Anguilla anguilla TaxID=7936 RepID=A0A0E9UJ96_ANGAN
MKELGSFDTKCGVCEFSVSGEIHTGVNGFKGGMRK